MSADLTGVSVLVAGAGLAGLVAARDLARWGAAVTVIEARDRVGGRVHTIRDGFVDNQHAESGGDMIDESQQEIRTLARDLGLTLVPILKNGWGAVRSGPDGKPRLASRSIATGWQRLSGALAELCEPYRLAEKRWDSPIASDLGRRSVAEWLDAAHADEDLRAMATSLRGFFLADPEELSLLALIDQFATDGDGPRGAMYRVKGGNDQLATRMAAGLGDRVHCGSEVVAVSQRGRRVRVAVKQARQSSNVTVDYLIFALPATLLRRIPITPALPVRQHDAIARLKYGRGTKTLLQFSRRFWRGPKRPDGFGSALPFGAAWDGNEEQRGRPGILSLLAGGSASDATAGLMAKDGIGGIARSLDWLGASGADLVGWRQHRWEADPLARGGYAIFDASYDPSLRGWLTQPHGRMFFAGEHTSFAYQGYMNGAIESGRRAAAELAATHRLAT